jgi:hypothetical protein
MRKRAILFCLLAASAAASGCGGGSSSGGTRSIASTPAVTATTVSTPAGATSAPSSPGAANSAVLDGVPVYQPSRTIKRRPQALLLSSPSSVTRISSYYASALSHGGWTIVSKRTIPNGGILTAKSGTVVASVILAAKGSGASIVIGAYSTR